MEINGYYPITIEARTPDTSLSLPYIPSSDSPTALSQPSDSYAVLGESVLGPIDALTAVDSDHQVEDPLERFMGARKRFLARSVQDLLGLIYERESLKYENVRRILYESAHVGTHLRNLGDWNIGAFKDIDKTRSQLEKEIAGLEKERRAEEVSCWRDLTRLKTELRETLKEFNHENEKEGLLSAYRP